MSADSKPNPFTGHNKPRPRESDVICMCKVSRETGDILKRFIGPIDQAALQPCGDDEIWHPVDEALAGDIDIGIKYKLVIPKSGAKPYFRQRTQADIEERKPKPLQGHKTINPQKLLAALEKAGIKLESADIY